MKSGIGKWEAEDGRRPETAATDHGWQVVKEDIAATQRWVRQAAAEGHNLRAGTEGKSQQVFTATGTFDR